MLRALLWKDARIFGEVFLAGLAMIAVSYLFAFLLVFSDQGRLLEWSKVIAGGASLTRFTSLLLSALLGAYAFARENEDRSILFLTAQCTARCLCVRPRERRPVNIVPFLLAGQEISHCGKQIVNFYRFAGCTLAGEPGCVGGMHANDGL